MRFGGWIFGLGGEWVELEAPTGVLGGDPYPDLLRAVREITAGDGRSVVVWTNEQASYRWDFTRQGDDVDVQITDLYGSFDKPLLGNTVRLRELVRAVTAALERFEANGNLSVLLDFEGSDDLAVLRDVASLATRPKRDI